MEQCRRCVLSSAAGAAMPNPSTRLRVGVFDDAADADLLILCDTMVGELSPRRDPELGSKNHARNLQSWG